MNGHNNRNSTVGHDLGNSPQREVPSANPPPIPPTNGLGAGTHLNGITKRTQPQEREFNPLFPMQRRKEGSSSQAQCLTSLLPHKQRIRESLGICLNHPHPQPFHIPLQTPSQPPLGQVKPFVKQCQHPALLLQHFPNQPCTHFAKSVHQVWSQQLEF